MKLHIIHLPHRIDRLDLLLKELKCQNITEYVIVDGIQDKEYPVRGIADAHKQIVRYAKENNHPFVLIAEDDILFSAVGAFEYYINNTPEDFDIYLGGVVYGKIIENIVNDFSGLTLYMVNSRFYDAFLALPEKEHLDRALRGKGLFKVCTPMIVKQSAGYSDNTKSYMDYTRFYEDRCFFN